MAYPYATTATLYANVPFFNGCDYSRKFNTPAERTNYFNALKYREEVQIQYMAEEDEYRFNGNYDEIIGNCNYMSYNNQSRIFYCFIDSIRYINPNVCAIKFSIDYYMTYQFDLVWKDCFIEREHVSDDSYGLHTVPEYIGTGEQILNKMNYNWSGYPNISGNFNMALCAFLSDWIKGSETSLYSPAYCGTVNLGYMWSAAMIPNSAHPDDFDNSLSTQAKRLKTLYDYINSQSGLDTTIISSLYMIPLEFLKNGIRSNIYYGSEECGSMLNQTNGIQNGYESEEIPITYTTNTIDGSYIPNNNKIWTYPYSYLLLDNNQGLQVKYRLEDMIHDATKQGFTLNFKIHGSQLPDSTAFMIPLNYPKTASIAESQIYSSYISKFPMCISNTATYENWLNGHYASMTNSIVSSAFNTITSPLLSNSPEQAVGGVINGFQGIFSVMAKGIDMENIPDTSKGNSSGSGNYSARKFRFDFYRVTPRKEFAKIIDDYFSMFGYKVNRLGTPEFNTRQYYNYYKIPYINIIGDIPNDALDAIKIQFNKGFTLWNDNDIGNYHNGSNPIKQVIT